MRIIAMIDGLGNLGTVQKRSRWERVYVVFHVSDVGFYIYAFSLVAVDK